MSRQKNIPLKSERVHAELRADAFNVFNHTQFSGINSTLNFGVLIPATNKFVSPTTTQNGVMGAVISGTFIPATPSQRRAQSAHHAVGVPGDFLADGHGAHRCLR